MKQQGLALFVFGLMAVTVVTGPFCALTSAQEIVTRTPANFVPDDQVEPVPMETKLWLENIFVEDASGVMVSMRHQIERWEDTEEYARNWNMESTGLYNVPDSDDRKEYFNRNILRYFDKRLAGEVKNAEEGSTMAKVGQVQEALRPSTNVEVAPAVRIKFKARVLQGKAIMVVENPLANYQADVFASGRVNMNMHREVKQLGMATSVDYRMTDGVWVANIDKGLTDNIAARISSSQSDKDMAFSESADKTVQLLFNQSF